MEKEPKNEMDTKKEYLHSYMSAVKAAKRIEEEIERLRLDKMLPSLIMDDMLHVKIYIQDFKNRRNISAIGLNENVNLKLYQDNWIMMEFGIFCLRR